MKGGGAGPLEGLPAIRPPESLPVIVEYELFAALGHSLGRSDTTHLLSDLTPETFIFDGAGKQRVASLDVNSNDRITLLFPIVSSVAFGTLGLSPILFHGHNVPLYVKA